MPTILPFDGWESNKYGNISIMQKIMKVKLQSK